MFVFTKARTGVDQGMRDRIGVHTIRDSYYHREKGTEKIWGGDGSKYVKGMINHQLQKFTPLGLAS